MEKEQKKLLLVAVSVGVFLLVTITAAIAILTPKANTQETAVTVAQPYLSGRLQPATVGNGDNQPVSNQETNIDSSGTAAAVDVINNDSLTINIPKPTTAAVPDNQETLPAERNVATVAPATKPAVAKKPSSPKPAVSKSLAAKPLAPNKTKKISDYWVQTGAFIAKVRAEDTKELLASKGITSIIENSEINGKTWYRVRVGPYTSENEAKYWLALVKTIDGLGESQVRQTVR
ncbi:MAG: SPOR domain-containing protein [Treponema sp.]|jgi:DedD protein|nr:SPOR domain-containing protein [Treponema sp.]